MLDTIAYKYFDSEPMTLWFGDEQKSLYVNEGLLRAIPFFANALQHDTFSVSKTRQFDLHDCDKKVVTGVIHTLVVGNIPSIKEVSTVNHDIDAGHYLRAWIIADRFGLENIANTLIDRLIEYHVTELVDPLLVGILEQFDHENSKLCEYSICDIAYELKDGSYDSNFVAKSQIKDERGNLDNDDKDFTTLSKELSASMLQRTLVATPSVGANPTEEAMKNPCKLHKHENTPLCKQLPMQIKSEDKKE